MKKLFLITLIIITMLGCVNKEHNTEISIIPKPLNLEVTEGRFKVSSQVTINAEAFSLPAVTLLRNTVKRSTGIDIGLSDNGQISFKHLPDSLSGLGKEGYRLTVSHTKIEIESNDLAGAFNAVQTLLQLMSPVVYSYQTKNKSELPVPAVTIIDKPKYAYRGAMLDVARHFFTTDEVKRFIDILAMHKINFFHWHLTDDQGWRIEIKKYPLLTEIGSKRAQTINLNGKGFDGKPHQGYYSQAEIKEVIQHAQKLGITVIPEIDMPGHMIAALASYPELACKEGVTFNVREEWGVSKDVLCVGDPNSYEFVKGVLEEVTSLFPGPYLHIGGDECPKIRWKECPKCQSVIKREGLKDEHELQSHFTNKVQTFLTSKGKTTLAWDEITEGGITPNTTIMWWRRWESHIPRKFANEGNKIIFSPGSHSYFNIYQADKNNHDTASIGYIPLEKTYSLVPSQHIPTWLMKNVLGGQGNLWTEYIDNFDLLTYMLLPRLSALAETLWLKKTDRDYDKFRYNLERHYARWDAMGVRSYKSPYKLIKR